MLWFGVPGEVASGLYFHQVTEKEGFTVRRLVCIFGCYRKSEGVTSILMTRCAP